MATKAKKTTAKKTNGKKPATKSNKSAQIVTMLKRAGGCTREQVLKTTGWPSVSMQALAKAAGVTLRVDKKERPFTYRA